MEEKICPTRTIVEYNSFIDFGFSDEKNRIYDKTEDLKREFFSYLAHNPAPFIQLHNIVSQNSWHLAGILISPLMNKKNVDFSDYMHQFCIQNYLYTPDSVVTSKAHNTGNIRLCIEERISIFDCILETVFIFDVVGKYSIPKVVTARPQRNDVSIPRKCYLLSVSTDEYSYMVKGDYAIEVPSLTQYDLDSILENNVRRVFYSLKE